MTETQLLNRITLNPKIMVGKPVIKGTRLTVEFILGLLAHGATIAEILEEYDLHLLDANRQSLCHKLIQSRRIVLQDYFFHQGGFSYNQDCPGS